MKTYIDGFVVPIPKKYINEYKKVAEQIAEIWKEYGAIDYFEYIGDDLLLAGTSSFLNTLKVNKEEEVIFGWVVFPNQEIREFANKKIPKDKRVIKLVATLTQPEKLIFNPKRMVYGGFKNFIP